MLKKIFKRSVSMGLALTFMNLGACGDGKVETPAPKLIFHSGFEGDVMVTPKFILNADTTLPEPNNWSTPGVLSRSEWFDSIGNLRGNGVNPSNLNTTNENAFYGIDLAEDPLDANNHALRFSINAMPVGDTNTNGRLEHVVWGKRNDPQREGTREFYYKFDMYISPDLEQYKNFRDSIDWMMIAEFWNDTNWEGKPYAYSVSINLHKAAGLDQNFHIRTTGNIPEGNWENLWSDRSEKPIPLGEWITCEMYYHSGTVGEGEFYFAGTRANGEKLIFSDKTGPDKGETDEDNRVPTRLPDNPVNPGIAQFNPFKLYTARKNITFINDLNEAEGTNYAIELMWDNLEYWTSMPAARGTSDLGVSVSRSSALTVSGTLSGTDIHMKPAVCLVNENAAEYAPVFGKLTITPAGDGLTEGSYIAEFDTASLSALSDGEYTLRLLSSNKIVYSQSVTLTN